MSSARPINPFSVEVTESVISDLRSRLAGARWPDQLANDGWEYGTELRQLQDLCRHWESAFDWDGFIERRNRFPQIVCSVDGQRIHAVHARSPEPGARPLLLTHGWPGSVAEFDDVIGPLTDPVAHGGDAADAFHVVAPSLPGYGFSGPTTEPGWDGHRIARAFAELMAQLGYDRFFAQGGDWGSMVTMSVAGQFPDRVAAIHVNLLMAPPPEGEAPTEGLDQQDLDRLARAQAFLATETGYQAIQSTKPQSLAYGLTDSPVGLAGWILEKFRTWSDCGGDVGRVFTKDRLLDNISIYWLTGTINSSMRLYYETLGPGRFDPGPPVTVPVGHAVYPAEIYGSPRAWAEAAYDIVHWTEQPSGGHFAAMEVPELFVDDVRQCFRALPLT